MSNYLKTKLSEKNIKDNFADLSTHSQPINFFPFDEESINADKIYLLQKSTHSESMNSLHPIIKEQEKKL